MYQFCDSTYVKYCVSKKEYTYEVTIIDSDFKETILSVIPAGWTARYADRAVVRALIHVYSKRNLDVAKNLFQYMKSIYCQYNWVSYKVQIKDYIIYIPEFKQYVSDLNKYIILS